MDLPLHLERSSSVPLYHQLADRSDRAISAPVTRGLRLTSLFDDLCATNQRPRTVLLAQGVLPAPEPVAEVLKVGPGYPVMHLLRLRFAGDQPLAIMENYLPHDVADLTGVDLATTGLYRALRASGVSLDVARQRIGARPGTGEECRLLNEPPHSPMLTIERVTHDDSARVVEYAGHLYRASRYEYAMTLVGR